MRPVASRWLRIGRVNVVAYDYYASGIGMEIGGSMAITSMRLDEDKETPQASDFMDGIANKTIFLNSLSYCPTCREFTCRQDERWGATQRIDVMSSLNGDGLCLMAASLAVELRLKSPFVVRRCGKMHHLGPYNLRKEVVVGPWRIPEGQKAVLELKQWLHGCRSKRLSRRDVEKAAVRRIRRRGLTASERAFFEITFGVAKLNTWLKNAHKNRIQS